MSKFHFLNRLVFLFFFYSLLLPLMALASDENNGFGDNVDQANLPYLDKDGLNYRTPRAGKGLGLRFLRKILAFPPAIYVP